MADTSPAAPKGRNGSEHKKLSWWLTIVCLVPEQVLGETLTEAEKSIIKPPSWGSRPAGLNAPVEAGFQTIIIYCWFLTGACKYLPAE